MHLRSLRLQGYKSFATPTEFHFDSGITAIVGPNGSGKSNIADAVRWVLGEQSYRYLRAKRSEDMIFAGSQQRARLGMAEVSMTLDNSDQWLPIEYSELTITRRAYRTGENEYYLNNNRVRLKDIVELLGKGGLGNNAYVVIGQGLVDAALSLRPQERRSLFEEAAGITIYQAKRQDALNKLEETRQNILRVNDIINEITPRLESLQRQAGRAEEYALVSRDLERLLRIWYGYRWHQEAEHLAEARAALARCEEDIRVHRQVMQALEQQLAACRQEQTHLGDDLTLWREQAALLQAQTEGKRRELAVSEERRRNLAAIRETLTAEIQSLREEAARQDSEIEGVTAELCAAEEAWAKSTERLRAADEGLKAAQSQSAAIEAAIEAARQRVFHLATTLADQNNRQTQARERIAEIDREAQGHRQIIEEQRPIAEQIEAQLTGYRANSEKREKELRALEEERQAKGREMSEASERREALRSELEASRRELERLQERHSVLARLQRDLADYPGGVRAILSTPPEGVIGLVSSLCRVPVHLERAIESALGPYLQGIVVESWDVANACIARLKQSAAGSATFLPLDSLSPEPPVKPAGSADVMGLAADLIEYDGRYAPVFQLLLGRTAIVNDLATALRVLRATPGLSKAVTLSGEVLLSRGPLSGGTPEMPGLLGQDREWRDLGTRIERSREKTNALEQDLQKLVERHASLQTHLGELEAQRDQLLSAQRTEEKAIAEAESRLQRARQEIEWRELILTQLEGERQALEQKIRDIEQERGRLEAEHGAASAELATLQEQLSDLPLVELRHERGEAEIQQTVHAENVKKWQALLERLQSERDAIHARLEEKLARAETLSREEAELDARVAALQQAIADLEMEATSLSERIAPHQSRLSALETQEKALETRLNDARARLSGLEATRNQAILETERRKDAIDNLVHQIESELGPVELQDERPQQLRLWVNDHIVTLEAVTVLPEGLSHEISETRARLRRLGTVNPEAPQEYQEVLHRHTFLTEQAADLERAAQSLREVIAELDRIMQEKFRTVFTVVAEEFSRYFQSLFGGGSARLTLTDPDDLGNTGVDIIARPPGKRQQSLALLSGGERALTAAALIFALVKASSTPFCFLDEVDAMLDEVNVVRFRDILKSLSEKTQFVVITHNRYTIEAANTIYGISMGADGISQTVSLRLDQVTPETLEERR
ncbi:MAG: chromosome segregation protein SMC [Chloroflexi bacterium]|nr:chromosome segregation protein SMC [Chloroflexota bacterium]